MYINRITEKEVLLSLRQNPVTAIIGPRQCGKSSLAKQLMLEIENTVYLDLERPSDLSKLDNAEWYLESLRDSLICIDEVQRKPELFPIIRSLVDSRNQNGRFLILGSASRDLLKQSSETLAGRISYKQQTPFLFKEIESRFTIEQYIERGGFPRSLLANDLSSSNSWCNDFVITFLERDLYQWSGFSSKTMSRMWRMLAHLNGQTVNYTQLGNSLGVSNVTIRSYIDLLEATFMVKILPPYVSNLGKRLIKAPKVFISDSGVTLSLLGISNFQDLSGHPALGSIWEQIVITNLKGHFPFAEFYHYRTSAGSEVDIVIKIKDTIIAVECKASLSPALSKGVFTAIEDIKPKKLLIVAPVNKGWPLRPDIDVVSLSELPGIIESLLI